MKKKESGINRIVFSVLVFIVQLIICNYVHISPLVGIYLLPLIIFCLPLNWRPVSVMVISFGLGLLLDLLSGGLLGLNAGAAVFAAALRKFSYRVSVSRDRQDKTIFATPRTVGAVKFYAFLSCGTVLYTAACVALDCITFRSGTFILAKFALSSLVSLAVSFIISFSFLNRE